MGVGVEKETEDIPLSVLVIGLPRMGIVKQEVHLNPICSFVGFILLWVFFSKH